MPNGIQYFRDDLEGLEVSQQMFQWIDDYRTAQVEAICGEKVDASKCGNSYGLAFYLRSKTLEFFARAIYEKKWLPICKYVSQEFFANNFDTIIDIYSHTGSYYALEKMIKLLLGDAATFTYDNSTPAVITVTLTAETAEMTMLVRNNSTETDDYLLVTENDTDYNNFQVTASTAEITPYQVYLILQGMQVNGVRLNITF